MPKSSRPDIVKGLRSRRSLIRRRDAQLRALAADAGVAEAVGRLRRWDRSTPTGITQGYDAADVAGALQPPSRQ